MSHDNQSKSDISKKGSFHGSEENCCIIVKNLTNRFDLERTLCEFFLKTSGKIAGIRLEDDGENLAKATIRFEDPKSAQDALRQNNCLFKDRNITVELSKCQHSPTEKQWTLYDQQQQLLGIQGHQQLQQQEVGHSALDSYRTWNGIGTKDDHHDKFEKTVPQDKRRFGVIKEERMKNGKELDSNAVPGQIFDNSYYQYNVEDPMNLKKSSGISNQNFNLEEKHSPSGYGQNSSGLGPNGGLGIDLDKEKYFFDKDKKEHIRSGLTDEEKKDIDKYQTMQDKREETFGEKLSEIKENIKEKATIISDKILH